MDQGETGLPTYMNNVVLLVSKSSIILSLPEAVITTFAKKTFTNTYESFFVDTIRTLKFAL